MVSGTASPPAGSYLLTTMAERTTTSHKVFDTVEEAIGAARTEVARATRLPIHKKTLVVVSDDQHRVAWAAASDGWETDYRSGSPPEMG